ncbi:conserved hypothetical protein [Trichinella spiralis]|uniref:hypothetical protein n=1 Tax=Trichinella spiralis TaxID=6334 RepID=UPI0001EFC0CB|nr:conserved hypothetical protein [Trichinella spiralis]
MVNSQAPLPPNRSPNTTASPLAVPPEVFQYHEALTCLLVVVGEVRIPRFPGELHFITSPSNVNSSNCESNTSSDALAISSSMMTKDTISKKNDGISPLTAREQLFPSDTIALNCYANLPIFKFNHFCNVTHSTA